MNALTTALDIPAFDPISYDAALRTASVRAQHSFFDQHVIEDEAGCFLTIDEANIARAASFMSVVIDPEWDEAIPF